jgi:hypothetical protein
MVECLSDWFFLGFETNVSANFTEQHGKSAMASSFSLLGDASGLETPSK